MNRHSGRSRVGVFGQVVGSQWLGLGWRARVTFSFFEMSQDSPNHLLLGDEGDDAIGASAVALEGIGLMNALDKLCPSFPERGALFGGQLLYWFSVKMTARLDVNATPGGRMSPIAPEIVPECSGASRVKRATRAGFAALDTPCALWYSLLVGERERSGLPGIRVFMQAPCSYAAHAAPPEPARVSGPAPTRSLWPCHP